jgi:hypothetical protein
VVVLAGVRSACRADVAETPLVFSGTANMKRSSGPLSELGNRLGVLHDEIQNCHACKSLKGQNLGLEAPPGFEPGMEVLQTGPGSLSC